MKKQKNNTYKKTDYLFSVSNDDYMFAWSRGSTQQYLSAPTKLIDAVNIKKYSNVITTPQNALSNIQQRYGIIAMAHTQRMKDFYHFVNMATYTNIEFVLSGSMSFRINNQKFKVGTGEVLILPKGTTGQLRILQDNTKFFWINVNPKCEIFKQAGKYVSVKSISSFQEITTILKFYQAEIYNSADPQILENYAETFYNLLMRDFAEVQAPQSKVECLKRLVGNIKKNPEPDCTTTSASKKLRMTIYELDKLALEIYGEKFSKLVLSIRMKEAIRLLKIRSLNTTEVARKMGYKSRTAFSRAFKNYYGKAPRFIDQ